MQISKNESAVMHRSCKQSYPMIASGEGMYLIDSEGNQYLDACGGAAVSSLGHNNAFIKRAMIEQIESIPYAHTSFFTNAPQEQLAEDLIQHAPGNFSQVYFVSGGSEAVETALKLARQYFVEIGQPQRKHIIARHQSYHGNTLAALAVGGNQWRKKPFAPMLPITHHIPACFAYREKNATESEYEYGQRAANFLEEKILELGADEVAAFVAEPVVGATTGAVPAVEGYFKRIREICDQYGVLLILDEVMCGMGRTGTLHACEQDGIHGDLQTIAKGIAGGYQPLGAVLISDKINQAIANGSGFFQHGHTYIGHPVACAAGLAVQQYLREHEILENTKKQGKMLMQHLKDMLKGHPHVGDIRGRGLFIGLELVKDTGSKATFDPTLSIHAKCKKQAFKNGLMIYPMGGTIDGQHGDHILLAPPLIITEQHVEQIAEKLTQTINQVTLQQY